MYVCACVRVHLCARARGVRMHVRVRVLVRVSVHVRVHVRARVRVPCCFCCFNDKLHC